MGKWAQCEKLNIRGKVFSFVNVIILTLVRPNLLVFKQKVRTGQRIVAHKAKDIIFLIQVGNQVWSFWYIL